MVASLLIALLFSAEKPFEIQAIVTAVSIVPKIEEQKEIEGLQHIKVFARKMGSGSLDFMCENWEVTVIQD